MDTQCGVLYESVKHARTFKKSHNEKQELNEVMGNVKEVTIAKMITGGRDIQVVNASYKLMASQLESHCFVEYHIKYTP